jgi:hypothetical protein
VLADLAKRTLRHKIPALIDALQGRFTEHHAFMVSQYLAQLDTQQATIDALTDRIETVIAPFAETRDALVTIPGISQTVADVIIAETGADMTVFPSRSGSPADGPPAPRHPPRREGAEHAVGHRPGWGRFSSKRSASQSRSSICHIRLSGPVISMTGERPPV